MKRLDLLLVEKQLVRSRTQAIDLIKAGKVLLFLNDKWLPITKNSFKCTEDIQIKIDKSDEFSWVSRSGQKLHLALQKLGLSLEQYRVLDLGQSTGGFTECALFHGAELVVGVDVGSQQLSSKLREDSRVVSYENVDVRLLHEHITYDPFDFLVMDLSFISITKTLEGLSAFLKKGGEGLLLVKPQFEVGKAFIEKGGKVNKQEAFLYCQKNIFECIKTKTTFTVLDYFPSDLRGKDGNQEFFCYIQAN